MGFSRQNTQDAQVWDSFNAGNPVRMPVVLGINPRVILLNPALNVKQITFKQYMESPDTMMDIQLQFADYRDQNYAFDQQMDAQEQGWFIYVDFQNVFDAAWFGGTIEYPQNNCPHTKPFLHDDNKNMLFEKGFPGAFEGLGQTGMEYYEYFLEQKQKGLTYKNKPIDSVGAPFMNTDGPFTVACNIRGTANFIIDLYEEPNYAEQLLSFITEATIRRIKSWRKYLGQPERSGGMFFADDSIALLSMDDYTRFILPYHKRLIQELTDGSTPNSIHLCGDASRFFVLLRDELNIRTFDTGFPIDFAAVTKRLGPNVTVQGGVNVSLLLNGTAQQIYDETVRIIKEVTPNTKRFIMREANNLCPCTPPENIQAMYNAVLEHGWY